jgi:hypothetical protein
MYLVSVTPEHYLMATHFNSIDTTAKEEQALKVEKDDVKSTIAALRRLGYEPLLVKIT